MHTVYIHNHIYIVTVIRILTSYYTIYDTHVCISNILVLIVIHYIIYYTRIYCTHTYYIIH